MSLVENIGSYRFDVLELVDQYCIEPKNKEVKRRVKSMMENIMRSCIEIDTAIASSTLEHVSILVKIIDYHVNEMTDIMNCINKLNLKLAVRFTTHYIELFLALNGFKNITDPVLELCAWCSLDVDINVTDDGVSITPTNKLDLKEGNGYKIIIKTNFNICSLTQDFYSFYYIVHNDTNMNSLWLMYREDILNRISIYTRNVLIKGRMTKEKHQLIKMTTKLVEEINLMFVEVEQE